MAIYDITSYGAVSNNSTDCQSAFTSAINAANAAGGGIVYVPGGGSGYKINSRHNAGSFPNELLPKLGDGVTIRGDGQGQSKIIVNQDYDLFSLGKFGAGGSTVGNKIIGLTIQAAVGFFGNTGFAIHLYDALDVLIEDINITDVGMAYGPNGEVWAKDGSGNPRYTPATGQIGVGFKGEGNNNYKVKMRDSQINGCVGAAYEIGRYNTSSNWPQGIAAEKVIFARSQYGAIVFAGDANPFVNCLALQNKSHGFAAMPRAGQTADLGCVDCGADTNGGHGYYLWDGFSGAGAASDVNLDNCWSGNNGHPTVNPVNQPSLDVWAASKGVMVDQGMAEHVSLNRVFCAVNGNDGAEICATVDAQVWDSKFQANGQVQTNGGASPPYIGYSGLYVNNNTANANIQRNRFLGTTFGPYADTQGYGLYVNNTNITINMLHANESVGHASANYTLGMAPGVNSDNI